MKTAPQLVKIELGAHGRSQHVDITYRAGLVKLSQKTIAISNTDNVMMKPVNRPSESASASWANQPDSRYYRSLSEERDQGQADPIRHLMMVDMSLYSGLFRHGLSKLDPEFAHHWGMVGIRAASRFGATRLLKRDFAPHPSLARDVMGLQFPSPFGMAAGFDKAGQAIPALGDLGFGHVEIGTITAHAQPGNPKPRLHRLVEDRAVVNRMGFNNDGAETVAARLQRLRNHAHRKPAVRLPIIGVNIGKTKTTPLDEAVADYRFSSSLLSPYADYLVVNVSSPNTPGLRELQEAEALAPILDAVKAAAGDATGREVPVLVKLAPDLQRDDLLRISDLAGERGISGIIATNTTIKRATLGLKTSQATIDRAGAGGLSGAPLADLAYKALCDLKQNVGSDLTLVACGGVTTAKDVTDRLEAGADLVQGYTAYVYEGPSWARKVNQGLLATRPKPEDRASTSA